ncbi:terpene cyclase/mutase family protein [Streptomyces sp. BE147]|uniref:prenyltransferase/squalene oxidase repeat-containing protein n=1 Tax=Streptomyces sp. BE147 TaxID=3002524 RepID=UPI002E7734DE|nr:prenyltransferase/squalene oxidase repeat-containing protein [Streptomyces sp. BE147]MEE1735816.1 terpene cyclase/mutase family protein [Streptomyces sp. BE147]
MPRTSISPRLAFTAAVSVGALCLSVLPAAATATPAQIATSRTNGVAYLKSLQAADGSYAGPGLSNEWAFSALASAGTAAVDVAPGGDTTKNARSVYRSLLATAAWPSATPVVTDFERAALNAYAAGIDPARVSASRNLIGEIYSYWQTAEPGYFGPSANFNGTVFAALALGGARTQTGAQRIPQSLRDALVTRIRANQHNDGGWNYGKAEGDPGQLGSASDIDMTGAAMAALCVSGVANTDTDIARAKAFLKSKLVPTSGAFNAMFGVNTDSNGWAVSGLNACGVNPQTGDFLTSAGKTPVDFLISQQFNPGGGFKYLPSDTTPSAYASIDGLRAVAGGGFTAAPPVPATGGAPRWVAQSAFTTGTATKLALTVDDGSGSPKVCSVAFTPTGTTATLGSVLDSAVAGATPAGCASGVTPSSGTGTLTALNGRANSGQGTWKVSVDGAAFTGAARGSVINVGDTVALRWGV